jgi:hypothetical protein
MHQYVLTSFTPGEVEKITGLSNVMQRDWRRRGFLPSSAGHARFDPFALAEVFVMKLLADRGIGPVHSKEVADWCAIGVLWHALKAVDAYEGDHHRTFEWEPEEFRPKPDPSLVAAVKKMVAAAGEELPEGTDFTWGAKADWLTRQILRQRGHGRVIPARFFIWWADGTHGWHESVDQAFSDSSSDPRYAGAVIALDLGAIAGTMSDRAGRAFVHVEYETDDGGSLLSPVQYGEPVALDPNAK